MWQTIRGRLIFSWRATLLRSVRHCISLAGIAVFVLGPVSAQQLAQALDMPAVRNWTFDLERSRPFIPPYVATFERDGRRLTYVAARHVEVGPGDALQHPTLRTIRDLFDQNAFDLILVEGLTAGQEASASLLNRASECEREAYRSGCGESFYLVNLGRRQGVPVQSVEPAPMQVRDQMKALDFSESDLLGYYLLRQIPQMRRQATLDPGRFRAEARLLLERWRRAIGSADEFSLEAFEQWYGRHMPTPGNYLDVTAEDSALHSGASAHHVQRVSAAVNRIRDQAAVLSVQAALPRHRRILLVMGSSHLLTQWPALQALLGEARFDKLH